MNVDWDLIERNHIFVLGDDLNQERELWEYKFCKYDFLNDLGEYELKIRHNGIEFIIKSFKSTLVVKFEIEKKISIVEAIKTVEELDIDPKMVFF